MGIAEIISAMSFLLNFFNTGKNVWRERKDGDLLPPLMLGEAYENLQYLRENTRKLRIALSQRDSDDLRIFQLWNKFFNSLGMFASRIKNLNLSVLSIYDREAATQLAQAFGVDSELYDHILERIKNHKAKQVPKPPKSDLKTISELNDRFRVLYQPNVSEMVPVDMLFPETEQSRADYVSQLSMLEEVLEKCSEQLATFIRVNWAPKDLS